jgi:hypothetical protein
MNISFNIQDDLGAQFVTASKWVINRPDLTDDKVCDKYLKQKIGELVDSHRRFTVLGEPEIEVSSLRTQVRTIGTKLFAAEVKLNASRSFFESGFVATDTGPD